MSEHGGTGRRKGLSTEFGRALRKSFKISHRALFSLEEYRQLFEATRARIKDPKKKRYLHNYEQLHDFFVHGQYRPAPDEDGADIYRIAMNCRTSVEMIENLTPLILSPRWTQRRSTFVAHGKLQRSRKQPPTAGPRKKPRLPQRGNRDLLFAATLFSAWRGIDSPLNGLRMRAWRNGRRKRLTPKLSARRETGDAELLKVGETCKMAIPSQAAPLGAEGVETRRAASKLRCPG